MNRNDLVSFYDKPCRVKMRGGKEVFGMIWENSSGDRWVNYFASAGERLRYKIAEQMNDRDACERLKTEIHPEDIMQIEPLAP